MIHKSCQQDGQRENFTREKSFGHQIGILDDNRARSLKGFLKKEPGEIAAEKEQEKTRLCPYPPAAAAAQISIEKTNV